MGARERQRSEIVKGAPAVKPLFIPLKGEYYDAFLAGTKDTEYRRAGRGWNKRTCWIGRPATLSRGYGKKNRLHRTVQFYEERMMATPEVIKIYGKPTLIACIYLPKPKEL